MNLFSHSLNPGPVVDLVFIIKCKAVHPYHLLRVDCKGDQVAMADRVVEGLQFEGGVTVGKLGPEMTSIYILKCAEDKLMTI